MPRVFSLMGMKGSTDCQVDPVLAGLRPHPVIPSLVDPHLDDQLDVMDHCQATTVEGSMLLKHIRKYSNHHDSPATAPAGYAPRLLCTALPPLL
jgi:hypothetical protein